MRYMQPWQRYENITCASCGQLPGQCHRFGNWLDCFKPNPRIQEAAEELPPQTTETSEEIKTEDIPF